MKKYEYAHLKLSPLMVGPVTEEHRVIIDEYARRGYRYVGFIPTRINGYGRFKELDLVFEADAGDL